MQDLQSQIQQAKQAGYGDEEILGYLASKRSDLAPKIQQAKQAGYAPGEIVSHLGGAASAQGAAKPPDVFEQAVNYHTGNTLVDAPLGLVQGFAKGAASTGVGIGNIYRKLTGQAPAPEGTYDADTKPSGIGQGTGKFAEQALEFAAPGGAVTKATRGLGLATRVLAQAGTAGAVGAAQTGGDPTGTLVSAGLGAAGEAAPAILSKVKALADAKAPTLQNFSKSFANATPTQKAVISDALPQLTKDGIQPTDPHAMSAVIKGKLGELGTHYQALEQSGAGQAPADAGKVLTGLQKQADALKRGNVLSKANEPAYQAIQNEMQTVQELATQNGGKLTFDDVRYLRDGVNGKTNFNSPDWERDLYGKLGNTYRSAMDEAVPGSAELNRAYAKYSKLDQVLDTNIARGKADTKSGLDALLERAASHGTGAYVGGQVGGLVAGHAGAAIGGTVGAIAGPRLAKTAQQIFQNALDNGSFQNLSRGKQALAAAAARMGDANGLARLLSSGAQKEAVIQQTQ